MKNKIPILTTTLSLIVAIGGLSFGISAAHQKNVAEAEANQLRLQLAQKQAPTPELKPPDIEPSINTNTLTKLEAELALLRTELDTAKANQTPQRESWEERMARMKAEDPEGYAEMIKNRTERREAIRYDLAERTANFMELDSTFMTEAEYENHLLLIEKMAAVWELSAQFNDPEQQPNRDTMRELFGAINEARPLMEIERTTLFRQLANDIGYEGEAAQEFSGYLEEIISSTTIQPPRRGGRRGL